MLKRRAPTRRLGWPWKKRPTAIGAAAVLGIAGVFGLLSNRGPSLPVEAKTVPKPVPPTSPTPAPKPPLPGAVTQAEVEIFADGYYELGTSPGNPARLAKMLADKVEFFGKPLPKADVLKDSAD
ncbi:MAG: hypothetical protein KDK97_17845, partial [Verrucomicrobiales bacterium]|nr:hypothetical protein [Verrucomicrobiales bacterium]